MTVRKIFDVLALFSILGGIIIAVAHVWFNVSPNNVYAFALDEIGWTLILLGLIAIYFRQYQKLGVFGFISFLFFMVGLTLYLAVKWLQTFMIGDLLAYDDKVIDSLPTAFAGEMFSLYSLLLGGVLFGIANAWKGVRSAGWLLILGVIADLIPFGSYVSQIIAGIAFIWLGYAVRKNASETEELLN